MKRLFILLSLLYVNAFAAPPASFYFSVYAYAGDYSATSGTNADAPTSPFAFQGKYSVYPNVLATSLNTTPYVQNMLSAMPPKLTTLTWAFATGTCGSETWASALSGVGGISGAAFGAANVAPFVAAGKKYIVSTGGGSHFFYCTTQAGLDSLIANYYSANMIGVDFDIEGLTQAASYTASISGTTMTVTAVGSGIVILGQTPTCTGITAGTQLIAYGSGTGNTGTYTVNTSQTMSSTTCTQAAAQLVYTQAYINSLVQALVAVQNDATHPLYQNMQWSFNVGGYGGNVPSYGVDQYGAWLITAINTYGLTNYVIQVQVLDPLQDASHCVILAGVCEMGLTTIQAMRNVNSYYGVPYSHLAANIMYGGNDYAGGNMQTFTLADIYTVSNWFLPNGLKGITPWALSRDIDCAPQPSGNTSDTCNNYGLAGTLGFTNRFLSNLNY